MILLTLASSLVFSQEIDWINKTITVEGAAYGKNKLIAQRGAKLMPDVELSRKRPRAEISARHALRPGNT